MNASDFSTLIASLHRVGVKGCLLEFPEAAAHKSVLTRLSLAEEMAGEKEAELQRAQAHVDKVEAELRAALGVQNDA